MSKNITHIILTNVSRLIKKKAAGNSIDYLDPFAKNVFFQKQRGKEKEVG